MLLANAGKSRRVRCDGGKPACSSCVKTAKWKHEDVNCVYRADLYVQRCREAEEQQRRGVTEADFKHENSDDSLHAPEDMADQPDDFGFHEEPVSARATPTCQYREDPSRLPGMSSRR